MDTTLSEYFRAARLNPTLRLVATPGAGSFPHLIGSRLFRENGLGMDHVPYDGGNPAMTALLGGHVGVAIVPYPDFIPYEQSGKVQLIARSGSGIVAQGWLGIFAPKGISQEEIGRLAATFRLASDACRNTFPTLGLQQVWAPAHELQALHKRSYELWKPELDLLGIRF